MALYNFSQAYDRRFDLENRKPARLLMLEESDAKYLGLQLRRYIQFRKNAKKEGRFWKASV